MNSDEANGFACVIILFAISCLWYKMQPQSSFTPIPNNKQIICHLNQK